MGRPALHPDEIHEFRERLCDAALRLFAERGYAGFTLRALGSELDCSPATPYRYFRNKADIFEAVCARAFEDLCAAQEVGRSEALGGWEGIRAQGRSYVAFARSHPHAYRVMFDLRKDDRQERTVELYLEPVARSWEMLLEAFELTGRAGRLDGDPKRLAFSFWASLHGVMSLELSGRIFAELPPDQLVADVFDRFERAYRIEPRATGEPS
ncbi:MAG: TetR/AcrR family transcriptional regulator [Myxococcota bacterium]|nr:TetR/AcrR family transcriptional regulator [Myxococcota bacterium]